VSDKEPCILCGVNEWAAGVKFAEERIIKLLEAGSRDSNLLDDIYDGVMYGFIKRAEFKQRLIALIKGESQKDNETVSLLTEGENK
jgi:hypothetical protein